ILQEAIINKDFETIRTEAHKIKGGAANLTAMLLSEVAADLEQKGKDVQGEGIEEKMVVFKEEFQRLKEYVENDYK
ncbi:MAG: Hpt domain-containing protein, partial [Candidatus Omnitrophica bacterium]|nr:Hpt domain-containing protein [Candidatus Omnitrophota bacterium]